MLLTLHLCILHGSQNNLQLLSYTQSNGWYFFITDVVTVYCTVGNESYKPAYILSLKGYIMSILSLSATRWKQPNGTHILLVIICYDCIQ
jgi:hypothetical protein